MRSVAGSVADPDLTPLPAGGGVNLPILEACGVAGVIAQAVVTVVVVTVVPIARDVTVQAGAEMFAEVVISVVAVVGMRVPRKSPLAGLPRNAPRCPPI